MEVHSLAATLKLKVFETIKCVLFGHTVYSLIIILSHPNNQNCICVETNRLEPHSHPPTHTTNSKLHDRAQIEQYSENKWC